MTHRGPCQPLPFCESPACRKGSSGHAGGSPPGRSLLSGRKAMGRIPLLLTLRAVAGSAKWDPAAPDPPHPMEGDPQASGGGGGSAAPARSRINPQRCNACSVDILIRAAFWGRSHMNSFKRPLQEEVTHTQVTSLCPCLLGRHGKLDCHTDHTPSSSCEPVLCHDFPGSVPSHQPCSPGQRDVVPKGQ